MVNKSCQLCIFNWDHTNQQMQMKSFVPFDKYFLMKAVCCSYIGNAATNLLTDAHIYICVFLVIICKELVLHAKLVMLIVFCQ